MPLGNSLNSVYSIKEEIISSDDLVFLYTNGLLKIGNKRGDKYGINNLKQLILSNKINKLEHIKNILLSDLKNFHEEEEFSENITFVLLRKEPFQNN